VGLTIRPTSIRRLIGRGVEEWGSYLNQDSGCKRHHIEHPLSETRVTASFVKYYCIISMPNRPSDIEATTPPKLLDVIRTISTYQLFWNE